MISIEHGRIEPSFKHEKPTGRHGRSKRTETPIGGDCVDYRQVHSTSESTNPMVAGKKTPPPSYANAEGISSPDDSV